MDPKSNKSKVELSRALSSAKKITFPTPKASSTRIGSLAKASPKPSAAKTLPSLAEYKESAAYKSGAMTYKEYLNYFKSRGYK